MNFSESFTASRGLVAFSPDGRYIGSCSQHRVVVRDVASLQILHLHTCLDPVQQLLWSPDSLLLLTAMFKRGIVQVSNYSSWAICAKGRAYPTHVDRCLCVLSTTAGVVDRAAIVDVQDRRGSSGTDLVLVGTRQQTFADYGRLLPAPYTVVLGQQVSLTHQVPQTVSVWSRLYP